METTMTPVKPQLETPTTVIEPSRGWASLGLRDVWEYRELLYFLVWREVKVRYKQTLLGVSVGIALVVLVSGAFFFRRMEQSFVDIVEHLNVKTFRRSNGLS